MNAGKIIAEERTKRNLSQKALADEIGISQPMVWSIEHGTRGASDDLKIKIANYFNLSVEYIFFNKNYHVK